jgi:hypothetical protein
MDGYASELVQEIGPRLQELHALRPIGGSVVRAAHFVLVLVRERRLDYVGMEAALV